MTVNANLPPATAADFLAAAATASASAERNSTAGYSWATAVYQGIAENLVFQADQAKQSSMRETATAATKVNAHTAAHREQFPSLASAPTARQPAAHRDLGAAHPPAGRTPPASGAKRVHPGPSHQLGSSQVRKIDGREQASAPRGPSAEQRARNEAALGSATAFLHSPGITLKDAPIVANHCKDVVKHFFPNTVIGDPSPIHSVDTERENYLGISFRTNDLLLMMIAHPPTINGVVTLWQGEQGVMHPIVLAGVPLHFLDFQVRAALREAGNGAAPATQLLVDGFLTGDWSGMIFLPEGVPLPKNIQLGRHTRRTTILPAHIAVPCVTCRTRNPDHCRCAAPNCHFVHRESRLAAQQAAAAAYATAAAALTQSPAEPESDLAINSATVVDTLEIAPISGSDASPPTPAPLVDSPATVNPPTPIAAPPHSTPSVSGAETPVPCTQGDATLADPSLPGLVTGQSAPAPAAAAVLPPTTTTNACLANDSPPVSGAVAHLQRATPLNQSEAVAAMPQQSPSTHCGTVAAQARGSRSPTPATPDTGNPTPLESDEDAGMNEPDSDAAMSDEESDSEMTEITGQNELGQRTVTHLPKKSATTRSTTKAKAVTPTQAPASASTGAKRSRVSKKAATTTTTPALLKDPSIALLASNRTPRSRARASAPEAGVDAAGSGSTQTVTDLAAAGTATGVTTPLTQSTGGPPPPLPRLATPNDIAGHDDDGNPIYTTEYHDSLPQLDEALGMFRAHNDRRMATLTAAGTAHPMPNAPGPPTRRRANAEIPVARPTRPIPALNIISQNMRGTGRGGRTNVGTHQANALRQTANPGQPTPPANAGAITGAERQQPTDGEHRFRESESRRFKLDGLASRLRRSATINSTTAVDIALLQECNSTASPKVLLESRYGEYWTQSQPPGGVNDMGRTDVTINTTHQRLAAANKFDTAILVNKRLGEPVLQVDVSCPRATFVTIPDRGLLLVSIHGPFGAVVQDFHDEIISAVQRYSDNGWVPILGGDFNIAPFPGDRSSLSDRANETAHPNVIPMYEQALDVRDYAHLTAPRPPPDTPYSYANPRSNLFTFKVTNGVHREAGTYVSRVDLLLLPKSLLRRAGIVYTAHERGAFSDHKELRLHIPASSATPLVHIQRPFVIAHDLCSEPMLMPRLETILAKYEKQGMFTKLPSMEHFTYYSSLLEECRNVARYFNKRRQNNIWKQIEKCYKQFARLFCENRGRNRDMHSDELERLDLEALALADTAATNIQLKAAAKWIHVGDRHSRWQAMSVKQNIAPRLAQHIERLRTHPPGEDSADATIATGSNELLDAAHSYYGTMYSAATPVPARLASLIALHKEYVASRTPTDRPPQVPGTGPFTDDEIDDLTACAGRRKACGPNGIPAELYIHSPTARRILCHLGNIWLTKPHLVPRAFADGSIVILYKNKGSPESLDNYRPISLLNADLKILTSALSRRIAMFVAPVMSPEQFAIIPGRYIHDAIYKIQAAVQYLDKSETEAVIAFLDQAKAYDRIAHEALFAMLRNFQLPAHYIAAIEHLYSISCSSIIVNGTRSDPFPIARGVRQGDALSCVLFVIAGELLGCALRKFFPHAQTADIPMLNRSHMLYMDDTAVFLRSLEDWPRLQQALDWYCDATTAKFNESKTEILSFNRCLDPATSLPLPTPAGVPPPHPIGATLRYLGVKLGVKVDKRTRNAERASQISEIIAAAVRSMRGQTTTAGRAFALSTFIIPRFQFLFRFESFTMELLHDAEKRLRRVLWGPRNGFLAHPQTALSRNDGGLGLASLPAIYRATRLKQIATLSYFNASVAQSRPSNSPVLPTPDWVPLLFHLWRRSNRLAKVVTRLGDDIVDCLLFDPYSQREKGAELHDDVWPPAWEESQRICTDHRQPLIVDFAHSQDMGSALMRPLVGNEHGILSLLPLKSKEGQTFFRVVETFYRNRVWRNPPAFTVSLLPEIIDLIHAEMQTLRPGDTATQHRYEAFIQRLREYYAIYHPLPTRPPPASLALPYMLNWALCPKETLTTPPIAVKQYTYTAPSLEDNVHPLRIVTHEEAEHLRARRDEYRAFVAELNTPTTPEPNTTPAAAPQLTPAPVPTATPIPTPAADAPPAAEPLPDEPIVEMAVPPTDLDPGPMDEPEPIIIQFGIWPFHSLVRRRLDSCPTLVFPAIKLKGGGFSLPRRSKMLSEWKLIKSLHATPQSRNTIHRLGLNRIPKRQGDFPCTCHCGAEETVAHLTGECKDFEPLRDQLLPKWIELACVIEPTVRTELQTAAQDAANKAATEALAEDTNTTAEADALAEESTPADNDTPVKEAGPAPCFPALPTAAPELNNWVALPLLRWNAFDNSASQTAQHFVKLYQLASAGFIHLLWVARNDLAYSSIRWTRHRFVMDYNRRLQTDARATIPARSPIMRHAEMISLFWQDPAQQAASDPQSAPGPQLTSLISHDRWHLITDFFEAIHRAGIAPYQPP